MTASDPDLSRLAEWWRPVIVLPLTRGEPAPAVVPDSTEGDVSEPAECPASISGDCVATWRDGMLTSCREGECAEAPAAHRALAELPRRSTRKPKRGRLPELPANS